ncbi:MAG: hypothetical protein IT584_02275 [Chlamydiae bacterium]|nr:hypothetical protein [Chlamydiota bacterium]
MEIPPFLTNKQDLGITLGVGVGMGLCASTLPGGVIFAVAMRALYHYCGTGAAFGVFLGLGSGGKDKQTGEETSPLLGAVVLGAIGYGIERAVRYVFFKSSSVI